MSITAIDIHNLGKRGALLFDVTAGQDVVVAAAAAWAHVRGYNRLSDSIREFWTHQHPSPGLRP